MRDFDELYYQRINAADLQRHLKRLIRRFKKQKTQEDRREIFKEFQDLIDHYDEMKRLAILRKKRTGTEFYANEVSFYNSLDPIVEELLHDFYELFLNSKLDLNPDDPLEVALNQRAVSTLQLYGPHYREAQDIEAEIIKSELRRLHGVKKMLGANTAENLKLNSVLRNPDSSLRHQAWQKLSTELIAGEPESSGNYLKILRLRQKMQAASGLESPYNYAAMHSKLYFSKHQDWHEFKEQLSRYFMPLHEAFKQLRVRSLGDDYLEIENFLNLLPDEALNKLPQADFAFLERLARRLDHCLGEESLFTNLYSRGYMQESSKLELKFTSSLVTLPASNTAVMLYPDFVSCPVDLSLHALVANFAKTLLMYSTLRNFPGQELLEEAPFAEGLAELGLLAVLNTSPYQRSILPEDKISDALVEGISIDEILDLLLGRFVLLLPAFLLRAEFELQVNAYQLNKSQDIAEIWKRLSYKYFPELSRTACPAFKFGFEHQLSPDLFTRPFSSLEFPLALLVILNEQPWHRNNYIVAEKLNRFFLTNRSLSPAVRLKSAGFKEPKGEEFFSRAAFALADRLQL